MKRILIANRGEIALRAVRTCRTLGLQTVGVHSTGDVNAPHVWAADRSVCVGAPPPGQSYLNGPAMVAVALATGCDAVYPGYGFLSENAGFVAMCETAGLTFVGPSANAIRLMGNKADARRAATEAGVPVVPGSTLATTDPGLAAEMARDVGFPLLAKAVAGGGGRGMRVIETEAAFRDRFEQASAEARSAFGNGEMYLERFFSRVRHVEIQVMADSHGNAIHFWERDCSVQRRHQKLVEEAPSPALDPQIRAAMAEAALSLVRSTGYTNAGTVEFIFDMQSRQFYFIEMNTRIQVEHPVTESLFGIDLVAEQFRIARGDRLSIDQPAAPTQRHAIEFRINAENPANGFLPSPGRITRWHPPAGEGIRIDSHVYEGFTVSPYYDSLLAKLIVHGTTRSQALARARQAIAAFEVEGVASTLPFHRKLLDQPAFVEGQLHTRWIEQRQD